MRVTTKLSGSVLGLALAGFALSAQAASFSQGFNGTEVPADWTLQNNSDQVSAAGLPWSVGPGILSAGVVVVDPHEGDGYAIANYASIGDDEGTASNWLISPLITGLKNGDSFSFYTTTVPGSSYPDRLEFRLSTAGASTDVGSTTDSVGSFSTLLASVNPALDVGGYPESWTQITATVSGLSGPMDGRVAFRYYVTEGGLFGSNSNIIGVDDFSFTAAAVPEPATWAMAIGGLCLLAGARRARRNSTQG